MQEDSNSVLVSASSSRRRSDCATSSSSSAAAAAFSFGAGNMRAGILIELESCHCFSPLFTFFHAATSASLSTSLLPLLLLSSPRCRSVRFKSALIVHRMSESSQPHWTLLAVLILLCVCLAASPPLPLLLPLPLSPYVFLCPSCCVAFN